MARRHTSHSRSGLDAVQAEDLSEEINMLRELMRRLADQAETEGDLDRQIRMLGGLSQASARLAQVLRVQAQLGGGSALSAELRRMAEDVRKELESGADEGG